MDPVPTIPISSTLMPCRSGSVVKQLNRFIIGEHEIYPIDYDEAMSDVDVYLWKKAKEVKL